ncbi:MAG TPA: helix-turn-helix domain-containing protein [Dehalococcoidia bacterium]|nr:helix-turn-helix domain-containing protein [Dehalococcoidia bacterium]
MAELGNTLSRARRARAITLEDAERDTHVSKRYLQALENEDFSVFPAPVYARGFLRTYSRYLGLNPEELIRVFPNQELTVDITPLPAISRPVGNSISMNWVIAAFVGIFLIGAGLLLFSTGSDAGVIDNTPRLPQGTVVSNPQVIQPPLAATPASGQFQGRPISVQAGLVPNFVGADEASALAVLRDQQIDYVVIAVPDKTAPRGMVLSQTPAANTKATADLSVTLRVSRGPE